MFQEVPTEIVEDEFWRLVSSLDDEVSSFNVMPEVSFDEFRNQLQDMKHIARRKLFPDKLIYILRCNGIFNPS